MTGRRRLERANSASYTHVHINIQSHDAYTYMHIRAAGYSVKTVQPTRRAEGRYKER